MNANTVRKLLAEQVAECGSLREWAKKYDGSAAFACRVLNGHKAPSKTILQALGLEQCPLKYRRVRE